MDFKLRVMKRKKEKTSAKKLIKVKMKIETGKARN